MHQIQALLSPAGPIKYEHLRDYIKGQGISEHPGKGMQNLFETICKQTKIPIASIYTDLLKIKSSIESGDIKKSNRGRKRSPVKNSNDSNDSNGQEFYTDTLDDEQQLILQRLDERLAFLGKARTGDSFRKLKRVLDAWDELDAKMYSD